MSLDTNALTSENKNRQQQNEDILLSLLYYSLPFFFAPWNPPAPHLELALSDSGNAPDQTLVYPWKPK